MLGDLDTAIVTSDLSLYFMNDPITQDQLDHINIPTTIYDESDVKDQRADIESHGGTPIEILHSSSFGRAPSQAIDMPGLTGGTPGRKRVASDSYSTFAEDGSFLSSSVEDYDVKNYAGGQVYGSPDISPRSKSLRKSMVKQPEIKASPTSYGEPSYLSRQYAAGNESISEPMDHETTESRDGQTRTLSSSVHGEMQSKLDACAASAKNLLCINRDQSAGNNIALEFKTCPPTKIRPSYPNCEGSRGAIKTDSGDNVELWVTSHWEESVEAILLTGLVSPSEDPGCAAKVQPHFKTYSVGEQHGSELKVDDVVIIGSQKRLTRGKSSLTVDVGIMRQKRDGIRAARLQRDSHIVFRLCVLKPNNGQWEVVDSAQIYTEVVKIDQPLGAPVVTNVSLSRCKMEGGVYIGVKGRNLLCKSYDSSVTFYDPKTKWKCRAKICEEVTTRESMLFETPRFPLEKYYHSGPYPQEIKVSIKIKVDKREVERATEFTYYRETLSQGGNVHRNIPPQTANYGQRQTYGGKTMAGMRDTGPLLDLRDSVEDVLQYAAEGTLPPPESREWVDLSTPNYFRTEIAQTISSGYVPPDNLTSLGALGQQVADVHLRENSINDDFFVGNLDL